MMGAVGGVAMREINTEVLRFICDASFAELAAFVGADWSDDGYIFVPAKRRSSILAVGHSDFVGMAEDGSGGGYGEYSIKGRDYIISSALDDRLGLYALLEYLPAYGIDYDLLITKDEERGKSTAALFNSSKPYNWACEFDRMGLDCVMYRYRDDASIQILSDFGIKHAIGSYSDIVDLNIGVKGFNFGVGYAAAHSDLCHFYQNDFKVSMSRFLKFYNEYKAVRFPHVKDYSYTSSWGGGGDWVAKRSARTNEILRITHYMDVSTCADCGGNYAYLRDGFNLYLCHQCTTKRLDARDAREAARVQVVAGACDWCGKPAALYAAEFEAFVCDDCYDACYSWRHD